jgi:hypothetical protein
MILSWALIGVIVGFLLGLTGAGGAIIAVPLFVYMLGATLRDATVLSLVAVVSGALLNWGVQRRNTDFRTAFLLSLFSLGGSAAFKPLKAHSPEWVILGLFITVSVVGLLAIWRKPSSASLGGPDLPKNTKLIRTVLGGLGLGALVTMTGLGGGVLLVPLLTGVFGLSLTHAAATSLLAIILTSSSALVFQWGMVSEKITSSELSILVIGSVVSALILKNLLLKVSPVKLDPVRKAVVTGVILLSIMSLLLAGK